MPSRMYWMLKPAKIIATILEITLIIFLLIIFSDLAAINKIINKLIIKYKDESSLARHLNTLH